MQNMNSTDAAPEDVPPASNTKSILAFLAEQDSGQIVSDLSDELRDLTEAVEMSFSKYHGKTKGELNIKISLTLERGAYNVDVDYSAKRPKPVTARTIMWLGDGGNLETSNPKQMTMPFSTVNGK